MNRLEKLSLVYEFGNYALDHGATANKKVCKELIDEFIEICGENHDCAKEDGTEDELFWFEKTNLAIHDARNYLKEFMEV